MNPPIRQATAPDAASIAAVHIETWQIAYQGLLPEAYLDQLSDELTTRTEFWRSNISSPPANAEIWVTDRQGQANSFVALGPARGKDPFTEGEIYAIYVHPNFWNQGLGRALFAHATARLIARGFSTAFLWVLESNARARRFYEIAGWNLDGSAKTETLPGGIELREVCYQKVLRR